MQCTVKHLLKQVPYYRPGWLRHDGGGYIVYVL